MRTIYRAGRVITGRVDEVLIDAAVVVEDSLITWVGAAAELPALEGAIQDLGDTVTILPGLIDTHVHLVFDGSAHPVAVVEAANDSELLAIMLQSARQLLSVGVTTARDLGAPRLLDKAVRDAIAKGLARGPRMLVANAPLTVTGGHCWFFGAECDGVDEARRQVRLARKNGADCIKIMSTGGNMTAGTMPSEPQFTQEELDAIVTEAHKYGMKVTAHAHGAEGIRRSILAGVDSLEHFSFTEADGSMREVAEIVQLAADAGTYVCKTLCAALAGILATGDDVVPLDMTRSLVDRGVRIVAGTDGGIDNTPHQEYVFGLEGMAAFGMSNAEVLVAATRTAAESLGIGAVTGTLEPGKAADIIAVDGNPLEDLAALRNIITVMTKGTPYTPEFTSTMAWTRDVPERYQGRPGALTGADAGLVDV